VFSFLKDQGIRMENMGPEDVCGGNIKMILGLVWTLISHFQFSGYDDKAGKKAVLDWARSLLEGTAIELTNLTSEWEDGKVLCAIVHALRPDLLNLDSLRRKVFVFFFSFVLFF